MIQKPKGYDEAQAYTGSQRLPAGAYIIKILNTKVENLQWGSRLVLQIDINEGEHYEFYREDYENQTQEDKRWKGTYRQTLPADDGSQDDVWRVRSLKTMITAIEESNEGYHWDWNEESLKGKVVGALFNNKEFLGQNGEVITFTQCKRLISVSNVREGKFKMPKDDLLKESEKQAASNDAPIAGFQQVDDKDIPF